MAKRKNSVALFEVIKAQKSREEKATAASSEAASDGPAALRTPKWWFKRAPKAPQPPMVSYGDPGDAAFSAPPPPAAVQPGEFSPDEDPTVTRAASLVQRVVAASPDRVTIPARPPQGQPFAADGAAAPAGAAAPRTGSGRAWLGFGPVKNVGLDPEKKEVTFRLRYTTAIIAGFALLVAMTLAYVTGRQGTRASAGVNGVTSEKVRRGPILAGVLGVQPERSTMSEDEPAGGGGAGGAGTPTSPQPQPPAPPVVKAGATPPGAAGVPQPPVSPPPGDNADDRRALPGGVEAGLPRTNGLNYVIMQSYPDRKDADAAMKALLDAGIPCTVQRPPAGWGSNKLWSVVGTYGFPSPFSTKPEYIRYLRQIDAVSKDFAGKSKWKAFSPQPVKWRDS